MTGGGRHATAGRPWRTKPGWYAVPTRDRTSAPGLERFMARRTGAQTIELAASHVSLLSHPREVADLIPEAAGAVQDAEPGATRRGLSPRPCAGGRRR